MEMVLLEVFDADSANRGEETANFLNPA